MTEKPIRTEAHHRLEVFLGDWRAAGVAYTGSDSAQGESPWSSTHTGRWHTGEFFLLQDERAQVGGQEFDTLSFLGVDPETGRYVMYTFDNGGFHRQYELTVDGSRWTIAGATERAEIMFSEDNRKQTIRWEWKPAQAWVPLCDRVAERHD